MIKLNEAGQITAVGDTAAVGYAVDDNEYPISAELDQWRKRVHEITWRYDPVVDDMVMYAIDEGWTGLGAAFGPDGEPTWEGPEHERNTLKVAGIFFYDLGHAVTNIDPREG